jgi:polar amino acid transport system permease protein
VSFFAVLPKYLPSLAYGLWLTVALTLISAIFGFLLSIPLMLAILYTKGFTRTLARLFITIVRGTPLLVQLFFIYYGIPALGIRINPFSAALVGFILNSAAYQAEYLKGGFMAITSEQMEAAYSIGLTKWQAVREIIFPQAFRFAIPGLSNEIIYLVKYTSVAYIIQVPELLSQAKFFASDTFYHLQIYFLIGVVYLMLIWVVSKLSDVLEHKLYIPGFDIAHLR